MKTRICPTCGCSLVRLGISDDQAVTHSHDGQEHHFCCQGCVELFVADPEKYLRTTKDMVVCPSCLAEKPLERAVKLENWGTGGALLRLPLLRRGVPEGPRLLH